MFIRKVGIWKNIGIYSLSRLSIMGVSGTGSAIPAGGTTFTGCWAYPFSAGCRK
jgi:hypothetical protein